MPESQREIDQSLSIILAKILDCIVELECFNLDGIMMRLNRLETQDKLLIFVRILKLIWQ